MRVIKDGRVLEDDWVLLREVPAGTIPATCAIIPLTYWRERRVPAAGVWLTSEESIEELQADLDRLQMIALDFPKFVDGRSYSNACLLRRHGYRGELRAIGDVLRDQLYFMQRCGFDSFELRPDRDPEDAIAAFREFSVRYQPAADGAPHLFRYR